MQIGKDQEEKFLRAKRGNICSAKKGDLILVTNATRTGQEKYGWVARYEDMTPGPGGLRHLDKLMVCSTAAAVAGAAPLLREHRQRARDGPSAQAGRAKEIFAMPIFMQRPDRDQRWLCILRRGGLQK